VRLPKRASRLTAKSTRAWWWLACRGRYASFGNAGRRPERRSGGCSRIPGFRKPLRSQLRPPGPPDHPALGLCLRRKAGFSMTLPAIARPRANLPSLATMFDLSRSSSSPKANSSITSGRRARSSGSLRSARSSLPHSTILIAVRAWRNTAWVFVTAALFRGLRRFGREGDGNVFLLFLNADFIIAERIVPAGSPSSCAKAKRVISCAGASASCSRKLWPAARGAGFDAEESGRARGQAARKWQKLALTHKHLTVKGAPP